MRPLVAALAVMILILTSALLWAINTLGLSGPFFSLIFLVEALLYFGYLVLILPGEKRAKDRVFLHPYFREAFNADAWGQSVRSCYRPARGCLIKVRRKKSKYPFLCHSPLVEGLRFFPLARWYQEWRSDD